MYKLLRYRNMIRYLRPFFETNFACRQIMIAFENFVEIWWSQFYLLLEIKGFKLQMTFSFRTPETKTSLD